MSKLKDAFIKFAVWVGVFLIGVLGGMGALLMVFSRRSPKDTKDIEAKLREKSADDIIDSLDNADRVRAIISGHGVSPDADSSEAPTKLHDTSIWGDGPVFPRK